MKETRLSAQFTSTLLELPTIHLCTTSERPKTSRRPKYEQRGLSKASLQPTDEVSDHYVLAQEEKPTELQRIKHLGLTDHLIRRIMHCGTLNHLKLVWMNLYFSDHIPKTTQPNLSLLRNTKHSDKLLGHLTLLRCNPENISSICHNRMVKYMKSWK